MERAEEAVTKLVAFLQSESSEAARKASPLALFASAPATTTRAVDLDISFIVAPRPHRVPLYFTLPHEVLDGTICVVTKPPQRKFKDAVMAAQEDDKDSVAHRVKKVIDVTKLQAKFSDPVAMRALANSFDHFFVHGVEKFPALLTGEFLHRQGHPVWTPKGGFMDAVKAATRTAVVPRRGHDNITVRIGHTGLPLQHIVENCRSLVHQLTASADGCGLESILQIRLSGTDSLARRAALPIFVHDYSASHPGVLSEAKKAAPVKVSSSAAAVDEPTPKRRRK